MNDQIRSYPSELRGEISDKLYLHLEDLYNRIYQLSDQLNQPATTTIGKAQLKIIHDALQAAGAQPLNVNGLLGLLSQPQIGGAPAFTSFPPPQDPKSQDGALGVLGATPSILYRFTQATRSWVALSAAGLVSWLLNGIVVGTRATLNLINGSDITLTVVDNGGAGRVDVTIAITGSTGWAADWSGTLARTTQNADDSTTASAAYVQAEAQTVNDRLTATRARLGALVNDLRAQGVLKT